MVYCAAVGSSAKPVISTPPETVLTLQICFLEEVVSELLCGFEEVVVVELDFELEFEFELLLVSLLEEVAVTELDLVLEDSAEEEPLVGFRLSVELTKFDFEPVFDGVLLLFAVMLLTPD